MSHPLPASKPRRSKLWLLTNAGLAVLGFGLLGVAIWKNRAQVNKVLRGPLDGRLFALALAVNLIGLLLTFIRWYLLVRALKIPFRIRDALRLGFIGNVFNLVIPGAVGGDLIKAYYLYREQAKQAQAMASMVIDRIVGLLGLFLLAGVMGAILMWQGTSPQIERLIVVVWMAVAVGLGGLAVIFTPALYHPLTRLVAGRKRLESILKELIATASAYRERLDVVVATLAMAMGIHSLYVLSFYWASCAIFAELPSLGKHFLIAPLNLFTTAVPLPFGALGLSEHVSDQLGKLVNHPSGAVAMMAYRVLMYGGGLVSACVYLANLRTVREISAQAPDEGSGLEPGLDTA